MGIYGCVGAVLGGGLLNQIFNTCCRRCAIIKKANEENVAYPQGTGPFACLADKFAGWIHGEGKGYKKKKKAGEQEAVAAALSDDVSDTELEQIVTRIQ